MAIIIQSLTPVSPSCQAGSGVTFTVSAFDDSDSGAVLTYEWQFSTDGNNYTSTGLSNNTSSNYDTGPLTINQSGIYYRVSVSNGSATVFSDTYPGIGERSVLVYDNPSIIPLVDPTMDFYPTSVTKSVGQNLELIASATLQNADVNTPTLVNNINFQWQYSTDSGNNWINITTGSSISVTNVTQSFPDITPTTYYKSSTLLIQNLAFTSNLYRYRVVITYAGAQNTPVTLSPVLLLIDPVINIYQQPGTGVNDTIQTNCYKTSIANSGRITVQVGALTTATTELVYSWQVDLGNGTWQDLQLLLNSFVCRLVPGTSANTDLLRLDRFIYYDAPKFRCVITGVSGEASVISNSHTVFMTDVQTNAVTPTTTFNVNEDRYGNIPNRNIYVSDVISNVTLYATVDISRNNGLNGNKKFVWERQSPGSSTWSQVGDEVIYTTTTDITSYTEFPTTTGEIVETEYISPPLRVSIDNGAKYRLRIESSAIYTLSGSTKTITPYYSSTITVNVYRTVYITNHPGNSRVFPNAAGSFSVSVVPSSGSLSDVSYQWQYNTTNTATGWINIPSSSPYSGTQTDLLVINPVPVNLTYDWFRCVVSISGQLASVTSKFASLTTLNDYFTTISTLNDFAVREFSNVSYTIVAESLSAQSVSYQWQKSTNYNSATGSGTWSNISGQTTNTFNLFSLSTSDSAFYRVRLTSFGGEVVYSNVSRLTVEAVNITLLRNIVSSISVVEGVPQSYIFECEGISSIGTEVAYQWQIKRSGDSNFSNIGSGNNNSSDTTRRYVLRELDTIADNNAVIRCKLSAPDVPNDVYTRECTVTVIRRFTYYADVANKQVTLGSTLTLDLNPTFTGGSPSYMWQENGVDMGETQDTLVIPNINSSYNGKVYRCRVTLDACTQHQYSRNNVITTSTVTPPSAFTLSITISTVAAPSVPTYYSNETAKTGAAIGTVICIPKPAGYVEDASATDDDIDRWKCSRTGTVDDTTAISTRTSGSAIWSANKPSWASNDYISPKWLLSEDMFKGYIELRGQYVKALEFPELARQWGNKFGGSITGTYPNYNTNDYFRLPNTYAKRLLGTGNINNNSGSTSIVPLYGPDGSSGGDKNVPGSMGGYYNYEKSAQLPPGSPGLSGDPDGTADGFTNAATFSIGSFRSTGFEDVNAFAQPTFGGTVNYAVDEPVQTFTDTPTHNHTAVVCGWREAGGFSGSDCSRNANMAGGQFVGTEQDTGTLDPPTPCVGESHGHEISTGGSGSFDMVRDGGMNISDTTLRLTAASRSIFDNNMSFFLRNNEAIPLNAPYFRLKYMIKAY